MYIAKIYDGPNDTEGTTIHTPYASDLKAPFEIHKKLQGISDMSIKLFITNPGWRKIRPLHTLIRVYDSRNQKKLFDGRFLKPAQKMTSSGLFTLDYSCEDRLAYLRDSRQRWTRIQDTTVRDAFALLIENHNKQVEPHKQFKVGKVTVTNSTDNIYKFVGYGDTYEELKSVLMDDLGGYLVLRDEPDGTYIDYLAEVGEEKETPIRLRSNLKDFQREIDPTDIVTRIIPLGARLEIDGEENTVSAPRLDIKSINNGKDYIEDSALIKEFGVIERTIEYDDINEVSYLMLRAKQFFEQQRAAKISYSVTAVNMDLIDTTFEELEVGNRHPIEVAPVFDVADTLQIIGMDINSEKPQSHTLTIGEQYRTLSQYQVEIRKSQQSVRRLQQSVDTLMRSNTNLSNSLKAAQEELQTIQDNLISVDLENLPEELRGISEQIAGLQTTIDNLDVPEYNLATPQEDGLMSWADKAKLDMIHTTKLVDLDRLVERVAALEAPPPEEPVEPPTEGGTQ